MNILFLTLLKVENINERNIYTDLMRCLKKRGHDIYIVTPREKKFGLESQYVFEDDIHILKVKIGNITKCGMIEKGISTLNIEKRYKKAIKKNISNVKIDLVIYSTPPITFAKVVEYVKERDDSKSYLLLKDIFPQNAVDLGMMSQVGVKSIIYKYFRNKEKRLYELSDNIGCMSPANREYVIKHNKKINPDIVSVCPNSIEVLDMSVTESEREEMRKKYNIPNDKIIFVYGGNLGKPQGIDFIFECIKTQKNNEEVFFLIVGSGTEYEKLEKYISDEPQDNVKLMSQIPKDDYDRMVGSCDIGLIFLDHRFTIPNFPSRLLSYMQAKLPVFVVTDPNTDIGQIVTDNKFGWWCESNNAKEFSRLVDTIVSSDIKEMGEIAYKYISDHYDVSQSCDVMFKDLKINNS